MPTKSEALEAAKTAKKGLRITDYPCSKCEAEPGEYCEPMPDDYNPKWHPYIRHYARVEAMRKHAHELKKGA